jgi:CCR4-NOT transcription complex subunit 9
MQHAVFPHHNPYQPDWQHHQHAQTHHQYAQTQAAAAANAVVQQQQHYGRMAQNGGNANGNNTMGQALTGGDARDMDHGPGSMAGPGEAQISEENRKVLEWIAQVLNANTREAALLELSKKREQVPELALILWHSFGMFDVDKKRVHYC